MIDLCRGVHAFADGELPRRQARAFEAHLPNCLSCQDELESVVILGALTRDRLGPRALRPGETSLGKVPVTMELLAQPSRTSWALHHARTLAAFGAAAAALVLVFTVWRLRTSDRDFVLRTFAELAPPGGRPLVERLAYAGAPAVWAPSPVMRGRAAARRIPVEALALLEKRGDQHGIGALWLSAGEWAEAEAALKQALPDASVDNDLAIAELHLGKVRQAKERLDHVIRIAPGSLAAHWNRALIATRMGDDAAARADMAFVAAHDRGGWGDEARRWAANLIQEPSARPLPTPAAPARGP